jgi:hypothetical protein
VAAHPTGSRYICPAACRADSDYDFLVLCGNTDRAISVLSADGYVLGGSGERVWQSQEDAFSLRKGNVNLIVTQKKLWYDAFLLATEVAKRLNLTNKNDRIALFDAIIYQKNPAIVNQEVPF